MIILRRDPYSPDHHFKNYKRKTKPKPSAKPSAVKKPDRKREDRMELFSAQELSKSKLCKRQLLLHWSTVYIS